MKAKFAILCERCKCHMEVSTECTNRAISLCCPNCGNQMPRENSALLFQALMALDAVPESIQSENVKESFTISIQPSKAQT